MTEDILTSHTQSAQGTTPAQKSQSVKSPKHRTSVLAVFLGIFLAIVMIMLGERAIFDLNRTFNPIAVDSSVVYPGLGTNSTVYSQKSGVNYASDRSSLSNESVYYPYDQSSQYRMYKLLIHAAVIIPLFLLMFVFYFWTWKSHERGQFKVIAVGYLVFAFWMMLHLLGEASGFVLEEYRNIGVYVVLAVLAVTFTWLMVVLQRRANQSHEA